MNRKPFCIWVRNKYIAASYVYFDTDCNQTFRGDDQKYCPKCGGKILFFDSKDLLQQMKEALT